MAGIYDVELLQRGFEKKRNVKRSCYKSKIMLIKPRIKIYFKKMLHKFIKKRNL